MSTPNERADTNDFEFAALDEAVNYRNALVREFAPFLCGNVIEVGCGIGQMTTHFNSLSSVHRLISVEPEAAYCDRHRATHPEGELVHGTIDDVPASPWNAVVSINVLEHIDRDEEELRKYHALLKPQSGHVCLFVPARPEIYAPIDRDFGHFRRYIRDELRTKLTSAGFKVVRLEYFNFLGYLAWWLNFCLLKKRRFEAGKVRIYDRAIFPLVHLVEERVARPPLGQSLIAVAQA